MYVKSIVVYLYQKQKQKDMINKGVIIPDMISKSTILDVNLAWEEAERLDRASHDWIYSVDPETMEEVKAFWKTLSGHHSLYNAFVVVLNMGE